MGVTLADRNFSDLQDSAVPFSVLPEQDSGSSADIKSRDFKKYEAQKDVEQDQAQPQTFRGSDIKAEDAPSYQEILDVLLEMLGHDDSLFKEVMLLSAVMVKVGVRVAPESQLTKKKIRNRKRRDVLNLSLVIKQEGGVSGVVHKKSVAGK